MNRIVTAAWMLALVMTGCVSVQVQRSADTEGPEPDYTLTADQTHARFSRTIPPVLTVPSGAVIEVFTEEASDGQFELGSGLEAVAKLDIDPIHPLTGPVFVEGAQPGDVLAVTLHEIEIGDFLKVDLRIAKIVDACAVPEADKLIQLTLISVVKPVMFLPVSNPPMILQT